MPWLMLLVLVLVGGEVLARWSPRLGKPKWKPVLRSAMLVAAGVYAGALLTVSLTSRQQVLSRGESLRFCGFYLDCHMGIAVDSVARVRRIGDLAAQGAFHVISLRVSSDARQATLQLGHPRIEVVDAAGHHYLPSAEAGTRWRERFGEPGPLVRPVSAGGSYYTVVVFDLPADVIRPRLQVRDVTGPGVILESLLIGDDDSFLHPRPLLDIGA